MPFIIIGVTFSILSISTGQTSYIALGIIFITLGASQVAREKKDEANEADPEVK